MSSHAHNQIFKSKCIGSKVWSYSEKAIAANVAAVREFEANGTYVGYNPIQKKYRAGEFSRNDYYSAVIAACHNNPNYDGEDALKGMILLDEIRGRLSEAFNLKEHKIDHVLYGAIATACTYGAMVDASPEMIESAIGMIVTHFVPWRSNRACLQLSDSKGASSALASEMAIQSIHRAMAGFQGPKDIFSNECALFMKFDPQTSKRSPFDLHLTTQGRDFAVMNMHFKLGCYDNCAAGAI